MGGFLGKENEDYFHEITKDLTALNDSYQHWGSPDSLAEKTAFYQSLSVLSVPTDYHEPKGLFVLEAMANGVPVVQPAHGAFPELIEQTEGGMLVPPGDPEALVAAWEKLYQDQDYYQKLARQGYERVRQFYSAELMARESLQFFQKAVDSSGFVKNEPQLTSDA